MVGELYDMVEIAKDGWEESGLKLFKSLSLSLTDPCVLEKSF